jgi:aspartate kinase
MKIFKFGGASVKDSQAVKNVAEIMKLHHPSNVIVVVSAMGKTTNALEEVVKAYYYRSADAVEKLNTVKQYHEKITNELFPDKNHPVHNEIN